MKNQELWRAGSIVCAIRTVPDMGFSAVVCVMKDEEAIIEIPVFSSIEAEEHAHRLRVVIERYDGN